MNKISSLIIPTRKRALGLVMVFAALTIWMSAFSLQARAQDQDDPPGRVARLGYMEGSVSFEPAGESDWVEAVPNRPMTTGDKLWADQNSRAEVQLGSATIDLAPNTGFSFLNLDDRTVQIELSTGSINVRVRDMDRDSIFEVDTPNQAFTVSEPGRYRVEASENGDYTVVTIRQGAGESTGNGQSYTLHAGQRTTFSGTSSLNAEVQEIGNPDAFDNWSDARFRRYEDSPSLRYCSRDMVGYADLDDNGDWRANSEYGHVWFPRVEAGWAPYHDGHWAWIDPWGWTWVDDARWGYAPFHYGRWLSIEGRWGWVPGPMDVRPVYAPALVVFVGGGGIGFGGNVAWFPLGPREVYVPSYHVSEGYVNRVNVSNTTVNTTTITNVYNTTIVNNNTTITNVKYVNKSVQGAVTAVPQRAFASAQPVARAAVAVNASQMAAVPVSARAAVAPVHEAVMGAHANTANHVAAPPQAVANRAVIAKAAPPPPPPSFAAKQQVLAQHPGQAVAPQQMQQMRPANATTAALVKRAPPGKPATATPAPANAQPNRPGNPPAANERPGANPPAANRPGQPAANNPPANNTAPNNRPQPNQPQPNQPVNRPPENRPAPTPEPNRAQPTPPETNRPQPPARGDRPPAAEPNNEPNRPQPNQPPANHPNENRPPENRPAPNTPEPNRAQPSPPETNRPQPPARNDRPSSAQPNEPNRPEPNQPPANRPNENRPPENRPAPNAAPPNRPEPNRPDTNRPQPNRPPAEAKPTPQQKPRPATPEEKKRQEEQRKNNDEKPKPPQ